MSENEMLKKNIENMVRWKDYMIHMIELLETEEYVYQDIISDIFLDTSMQGETIMAVTKDKRNWYLNSRYNGERGAEKWAEYCRVTQFYGVVVLVGMANLSYIRKLREIYPEITILVYEPDKFIWNKVICELEMQDILQDEKCYIVAGDIGRQYLLELLRQKVDYSNYGYTQLMISPNYQRVYELECVKIRKLLFDFLQDIVVERNTIYYFGRKAAKNRCINLYDSLSQYNAADLWKVLQELDFDKIPAIIVAAGPSLDKNIKDLKLAKGKAFIIATDSANRVLTSAGVLPELTVTIDPEKKIYHLFGDEKIQNVPVLMSFTSNCDVMNYHKGRRYYYYNPFVLAEKIWADFGKEYLLVETGGSVANDAMSFAIRVGFKTIILIGQDLAYPNNKVHAEEAYKNMGNEIISTEKNPLFYVEDIYGNQILSDGVMDIYKRWIETQLEKYKGIRIIDATEGGAKIKGTEIETLKEAIQKECKQDELIDFAELINRTEKAYSPEEQKKAIAYYLDVCRGMDQIKKKLQDARRCYEKLRELNSKRKYTGSDFDKVMAKVTEYNQWMETSPAVKVLESYAGKENFEVMEEIYGEEDLYGQIKNIADGGIKVINADIEAIEKFKSDMEEVIPLMEKEEGHIYE